VAPRTRPSTRPSALTSRATPDNHRPTLSSDTAPNTARLKKSAKDDSYNLGFDDQGDKYQYNGVRTTDDGNYVLIFDPARKAFVLHRVDSTFHMNITRTPTDSNVESLRKQFPQLEVKTGKTPKLPRKKADKAAPGPSSATGSTKAKAEDAPKKKNKPVELTLPDLTLPTASAPKKPAPPAEKEEKGKKSKRAALSPVESEEDDDDDDGGLTIEYPEGNPAAFRSTSQYADPFPVAVTRRFSEFARDIERESEDDEFDNNNRTADGYRAELAEEEGYEEGDEYDDEEEEEPPRKVPSPARPLRMENPVPAAEPERYTFDNGEDSDALDEDFGDLEAELEREFAKAENGGNDSDSSVSEEE
jgi:hypothetical protein